jgi:hypothetical protein
VKAKIVTLLLNRFRFPGRIVALALFGAGVLAQAALPTLTLTSNVGVFHFGRLNIGTVSPETVITLTNSGTTSSMTISSASISGANAGDFTIAATTCNGATLTSGGSCTATINFTPLLLGVRTANLTVTDAADGSQHLVPLTGTGLDPALPNKNAGPVDPRIGYPLWYQDELGLQLTLCLDNSGFCVAPPPGFDPDQPPSVTTASINFPEEAFYWYADARITRAGGGTVRLTIAKEAAFTVEQPAVGQQITFERVRVIIDQLTSGATYTITHPFGVLTAVATSEGTIVINLPLTGQNPLPGRGAGPLLSKRGGRTGQIITTEDIGCGAAPCDFRASLDGKVSRFLKWDPAIGPAAPAGYLGDATVTHAITGSPFNTNFFKVDGPNVGGTGISSIQISQFTLAGKLFQ